MSSHHSDYGWQGDDGKFYATDTLEEAQAGYANTTAGKAKAAADAKAKADAAEAQRVDAYTMMRNQTLQLADSTPGRQGTILTGFQKTPGFNPTSIL